MKLTKIICAALLFTAACADTAGPPPPALVPTAEERILTAVDSLNAGLRAFHAQGGRLIYVYTIMFGADTMMAPVIAISLRRP